MPNTCPACPVIQQLLLSRINNFPHEKCGAGCFVRNQHNERPVEFDCNWRTENFCKDYGCRSCSLGSSLIHFQQSLVNCLWGKGANVVAICDKKKEVKINSHFMECLGEEVIKSSKQNSCMVDLQQLARSVFYSRTNWPKIKTDTQQIRPHQSWAEGG